MRVRVAAIAESNEDAGKTSLRGLWTSIRLDAFPAGLPGHVVHFAFELEEGDVSSLGPVPVVVRLTGPQNEDVMSVPTTMTFARLTAELVVCSLIVNIAPGAVTLAVPGTYRWRLERDGRVLSSVAFAAVPMEKGPAH